jgi:hypothetical protein
LAKNDKVVSATRWILDATRENDSFATRENDSFATRENDSFATRKGDGFCCARE